MNVRDLKATIKTKGWFQLYWLNYIIKAIESEEPESYIIAELERKVENAIKSKGIEVEIK